ncbi:MAG: hypothetical protein V2I41_07485 [Pseudomonadales bacterium]|jgi:arylsulfatase|nr:hypothetical protein [Pseudomonadales bacterium]
MHRIGNVCTQLGLLLFLSNVAAPGKLNVVLVVMDNLGWGEIDVYGGGILRGAPKHIYCSSTEPQVRAIT